jgi:hypothetical protein
MFHHVSLKYLFVNLGNTVVYWRLMGVVIILEDHDKDRGITFSFLHGQLQILPEKKAELS